MRSGYNLFGLEVRGFEPLTYGLQSHRSSQLSYTPWALFPYASEAHGVLTCPGKSLYEFRCSVGRSIEKGGEGVGGSSTDSV